MASFPCQGSPAPNLSSLWVNGCSVLKALPQQMHTLLPSLLSLKLWNCPCIESFPKGDLPSKLSDLVIVDCKRFANTLLLTHFTLVGESEDAVELFPEEGPLPSTVTSLCIKGFPNLKALNKGLQLLGSLKCMLISNFPQLVSLPEEGLPFSLSALQFVESPLLKPRCRKEEGEDWPKVAINMDGEASFDPVYLGPVDPREFSYFYV